MLSLLYWLFKDALFFFGMVSARGCFPKPLSRDAEQAAIAAMQTGDDDARRTLIEHNLRLVSHIAKKFTVPGYTSEDLVSVGTLGLIKAVNTFRPQNGALLSSYAARCIENAIPSPMRFARAEAGIVPVNGTRSPEYRIECVLCAAQREVMCGMRPYISSLSA